MKQEVPPFEAIRNYIDCTDFGIEAEKHLKTAVENYPNESLVLASMCVRLLRNAREGGALTLAVSKNYPDNEAALLYARVALDVAWILLSKDYVIDQFGFSRAKILMIANRILEQNPTRNQVEILLALAQDGESPQIFDPIASYYYDHFEVTSDRYATLMDPKTRAKVAEKAFPNDKKL